MNVEKTFNQTAFFKDAKVDKILFEANYPILFTMEDKDKEYLFSCPIANSVEIIWIGVLTDPGNIIDLLSDKITIREAFERNVQKKFVITQNKYEVKCEEIADSFPEKYLPSAGEYMETEDGEFCDEIHYYTNKRDYHQIELEKKDWGVYLIPRIKTSVTPKCYYKGKESFLVEADIVLIGLKNDVALKIGG